MGHPLKRLCRMVIPGSTIFPRRFIVERCERFHVHYRNFRFALTGPAFASWLGALRDAFKSGVECKIGRHLVLGESKVESLEPAGATKMEITLERNEYKRFHTKDAEFYEDPTFIHIHVGELRWEMPVEAFRAVADGIAQARAELEKAE